MRLRSLLTLLLAMFVLTGCFGVHHGHHPVRTERRALSSATPKCKPSHRWDGRVCRHNGRGHGARKHDYRPRGHAHRR